METTTHASTVWVTCVLCYRSHGALVDRDKPGSVKAGYLSAGAKARECDHTDGGVNQ
jgi:hypothetical protein